MLPVVRSFLRLLKKTLMENLNGKMENISRFNVLIFFSILL